MSVINYLVAGSNVFGLIPIIYANHWLLRLWMSVIVLASILMHLSERKHNLPGIYPFNRYSMKFLWFDRLMALSPLLIVIYDFNLTWRFIENNYIQIFLGGTAMFISENLVQNQRLFAFYHCIWHVLAYYLCYVFVNQRQVPGEKIVG